jgi:hypothetical protein
LHPYDSAVESPFNVHTKNGIIKFRRSAEGLYYYKPNYKAGTIMVQTVKGKLSFFTDSQVSLAQRAHKLLHALGCPFIVDLKRIIKMNSIKNCPVTTEDLDLAEKIYGPFVVSLKGKTVCQSLAPIVNDVIEITRKLIASQYNADLCIDTMFVNSLSFLKTVSKAIKFRTCDYILNRKVAEYKAVLIKVIHQYTDAGFKTHCINSDQEFQPLL